MIVVINSVGNNLASIKFALQRIGVEAVFTDDVLKINSASSVILPGVGTANAAMENLIRSGLINTIKNLSVPVLGICVGMQLLFSSSDENNTPCLGIIPGKVKKILAPIVPHMGWNKVKCSSKNALLTEDGYGYFVHSYMADVSEYTIAECEYEQSFSAAVQKDNFFGVQFHPEKSADFGELLLKNFLEVG